MMRRMATRLARIRVLALDVDGVLTDGRIIMDADGREIKNFDVKDGFAIAMWHRAGGRSAIITARSSVPVEARARDLKISCVYQDAYPKNVYYERMLSELGVSDDEVCYIGDDLPDLPLILRAGWGVAPRDAAPEVRRAAAYVTRQAAGRGAVRETVEMMLKAQGKWQDLIV